MRRFILIVCLIICSIFELNSATYNGQENGIYGNTYTPYIPFSSTSSNIKSVEYNTVKPLNVDGTVSIEYTTYKGVYRPRRSEWSDNEIDPDDDPIGQVPESTPIGDPDVYIIALLFLLYILFKKYKENILNKNVS